MYSLYSMKGRNLKEHAIDRTFGETLYQTMSSIVGDYYDI